MSLPKVNAPTFKLVLPSNKQEIWFRPFTVKEEKMLLIAQQSEEEAQQINTVKQIVSNCVVEPEDFNADRMVSFDMEYLFLKLRAKSVGEIVKLRLLPRERKGLPPMEVELNIEEIEPTIDPKHSDIVEIADTLKIKMKMPTFAMLRRLGSKTDTDMMFDLFAESIEKIYDGDEVYDTRDSTKEEVQEFIEQLQSKDLLKIREFFDTMPKLEKRFTYEWTNPEDPEDTHTEEIVLRGLISFLS